ncbi:MAG TPA: hypothetical protein PKC28_05630, partial [Bdellovibrionales bacterium]|nr:hypothetical protein [Bdellovibrionales bacterium]
PFEHYRPLFELARDRGYVLKGLNTAHDLHKRDRWIAQKVREWGQANSSALIFVVIGELHLAKAHLPKLLRSGFAKTGELLTLFQDVEALYFRLAQKGRDGTDEILKSSGDRFCLMVSPPWMKWQSFLMFLEHAYDRDLQEDLAVDYSDHVASLVELLAGDLRVKVSHSRVQVYCPSSKASLRRRRWTGKMSRALKYHLEHDMSFFLPEKEWLFLSRPTINHASTLAGQFLHAQLAHRQRTLWDLPEDFLPLIWVEAVGFFFSKWINPKRKPETLESLRLQLGARRPRDAGRPALLLALDHRLSEVVWVQTGRLRRPHRRGDMAAYLEAARMVGTMLGERLFQKVRSRTISLPELMSYLKMEVGGADFAEFYWRLIRRVEGGTEP